MKAFLCGCFGVPSAPLGAGNPYPCSVRARNSQVEPRSSLSIGTEKKGIAFVYLSSGRELSPQPPASVPLTHTHTSPPCTEPGRKSIIKTGVAMVGRCGGSSWFQLWVFVPSPKTGQEAYLSPTLLSPKLGRQLSSAGDFLPVDTWSVLPCTWTQDYRLQAASCSTSPQQQPGLLGRWPGWLALSWYREEPGLCV